MVISPAGCDLVGGKKLKISNWPDKSQNLTQTSNDTKIT